MARPGLGLTAGYAISLIGGMLSLMAYAHVLGAQAFGRLAVYLALVEAFQAIVFQWHRMALVRYWTGSTLGEADTYLLTSHLVWVALAAAALLVVCIGMMLGASPRDEWLAASLLALTKCAALYTQEMSRVKTAVLRYAFASLLLTLGATTASIAAWAATRSIASAMLAAAAVFALQSVICGLDRFPELRGARFGTTDLRRMLQYGLPLIPVFVTSAAMTRLDRPILAAFEGPGVVGVYAAASGFVTSAVSAACLLVVTPCYPWLLREMSTRSPEDHRVFHARLGTIMLANVVALTIMFVMLRKLALPLMLGQSIGDAAQPLVFSMLAIAVISAFRTHFFDQAYHLHARTKALMTINFLTMGIAVLAMYAGAKFDGCAGMLYGLLVANTFALLLSATFARSIVNTATVVKGAATLAIFACIAMCAGQGASSLLEQILHETVYSTWLASIVALLLFVALCLAGNPGSMRAVLQGKP